MSIAVAISGGVDSLVSALMLKNDGIDVIGIHFLTGFESHPPATAALPQDHRAAVAEMAAALRIPVHFIDLGDAFRHRVIGYFSRAYAAGRTPNPCMVCNAEIKFGLLLKAAVDLGADGLATGHYARLISGRENRPALFRGIDPQKDQSYFLARLSRQQLQSARFPLGDKTKTEVREMAAAAGLHPVVTDESQDICFLQGYPDYIEFLAGQMDVTPQPGPVVDTAGRPLGTHSGLHRYTIGQRRGINCPSSAPYYVVAKDPAGNRLVVGRKHELQADGCRVADINWIIARPAASFSAQVQLRYRSPAVDATVVPQGRDRAQVLFDRPVDAVAPGQGAVFYDGEQQVLGGGWIDGSEISSTDRST